MISTPLEFIVPRPKQSKQIFDGLGKHLIVRLLVLLGLKPSTSLIGICRKDDIEFKPSEQFSAVVGHDVREVVYFCMFDSDFAESLTFNHMLP